MPNAHAPELAISTLVAALPTAHANRRLRDEEIALVMAAPQAS
jgi:hypothetical protein